MSWISAAYDCRLCIGLTWSKLNYCAWLPPPVSSLPLSVMVHSCPVCINLSHLRSGLPSHQCCSSPLLTRQWAGHIAWHKTLYRCSVFMKYLFKIYGIWPQVYTHSANAVPLVWGSLRLAPIITRLQSIHFHFWINITLVHAVETSSSTMAPLLSVHFRVSRDSCTCREPGSWLNTSWTG